MAKIFSIPSEVKSNLGHWIPALSTRARIGGRVPSATRLLMVVAPSRVLLRVLISRVAISYSWDAELGESRMFRSVEAEVGSRTV